MSMKEAAEACGVSYTIYAEYERMTLKAKRWVCRKDEDPEFTWRPTAQRIADFWGELPEDVFPDVTQIVRKTSSYFKASEKEVKSYLAGTRENLPLLPEEVAERVVFTKELMPFVMDALTHFLKTDFYAARTKRERDVEMFLDHFGLCGREEHTIMELSRKYNLNRTRTDQIVNFMLRMVRSRLAHNLVSKGKWTPDTRTREVIDEHGY